MQNRALIVILVLAAILGCSFVALAQTQQAAVARKSTSDAKFDPHDISGVWTRNPRTFDKNLPLVRNARNRQAVMASASMFRPSRPKARNDSMPTRQEKGGHRIAPRLWQIRKYTSVGGEACHRGSQTIRRRHAIRTASRAFF